MDWIGWALLILIGMNVVFFGTLFVLSEIEDRRKKR